MPLKCETSEKDGITAVTLQVDRDSELFNMNECRRNAHVMRELRKAGVPVIGAISILSVEFGTLSLTCQADLDGDMFVYRWEGYTEDMLGAMQVITSEFPMSTTLKGAQETREIKRGRGIFRDAEADLFTAPLDDQEL